MKTAHNPLLCWVTRAIWGTAHITQERDTILFIQNLKAMGLWVLSLITCSTSIFLSDVRLLPHTCYRTITPSCVSPSICDAHPSSGSSFIRPHLLAPSLLLSSQQNPLLENHATKIIVTRIRSIPCLTSDLILLLGDEVIPTEHPYYTK